MNGAQIRQLRTEMRMNQTQFGSLVNAHFVTVSKWENGDASPDPYQLGMLQKFAAIQNQRRRELGEQAKQALIVAGVIAALFLLLAAAES